MEKHERDNTTCVQRKIPSWAGAESHSDACKIMLVLRRTKVEKLADLNPDSLPNFCCFSVTQLCPTLWPHGLQHAILPCPSPTPGACANSCPLSCPSCPFLLLPSILPSIRVFSSELAIRIRWPKYWSFSIRPSNEYLGLISFGKDWFDLLDTTLISIDTTLSEMLPSWLKDCPLLAQAGLLKYRCPPGENLH